MGHRSRKQTIHYLVINILKYAVYFTAFGYILSELGVNYTTYLASLSVIGLAVGFGSQGLVQDIVTGFFLIFEGQFDVGDIVEISGQTGKVQELGMRMTKLQSYQGQLIFIPNRNIAIAGRYRKGCLECNVDIALENLDDYARAKKSVSMIVKELYRQFEGLFVSKSVVEPPLTLKTGECFLRIHISIWPGQSWVIDQQLLPRIREFFARESIVIPSDRIVTHYHTRKEQEVPSISQRFRKFRLSKPKKRQERR